MLIDQRVKNNTRDEMKNGKNKKRGKLIFINSINL
jgi:hypothetical protein